MSLNKRAGASASERVLVVTALPLEMRAITAHLEDLQERELDHGLIAEVGRLRVVAPEQAQLAAWSGASEPVVDRRSCN